MYKLERACVQLRGSLVGIKPGFSILFLFSCDLEALIAPMNPFTFSGLCSDQYGGFCILRGENMCIYQRDSPNITNLSGVNTVRGIF